eukprot:764507-Hanusia_phi.AAC.3
MKLLMLALLVLSLPRAQARCCCILTPVSSSLDFKQVILPRTSTSLSPPANSAPPPRASILSTASAPQLHLIRCRAALPLPSYSTLTASPVIISTL